MDKYPTWAYGSTGYNISHPVLDYITSEQSLYYYQGEVVSLGIWLYEPPMNVSWIDSPAFSIQSNQAWYNHKNSVVIGHDISPDDMHKLYDKWKDPKVIEDMSHTNCTFTSGHIFNLEQQVSPSKEYYDGTLYGMIDDQFGGMYNHDWGICGVRGKSSMRVAVVGMGQCIPCTNEVLRQNCSYCGIQRTRNFV